MAELFRGFPRESIKFFKQLAAHNNRDWFHAHKDVYERTCRAPMQALVAALLQMKDIFAGRRFAPAAWLSTRRRVNALSAS